MALAEKALKAIAQPTRREILRLVQTQEMSAGDIAANFDMTQPAVSQHLKILKDTKLVTERREGTRRIYLANRESLDELKQFLGWMWDEGLARLKRVAEEGRK